MLSATDPGYWAAKRAVASFPVALGRIKMSGVDSLDLLHRLSTQDLARLQPGRGARTVLTSDKGHIVDLVTLFRQANSLLLLTSPNNQQTVLQWLDKYTITEDSQARDITSETALLAVLGPKAAELAKLLGSSMPKALESAPLQLGNLDLEILGLPLPTSGFALFGSASVAELTASLDARGHDLGLVSLSPEAYEALRVEAGLPAFGKELDERFNPLEAELRDAISFTKGCYIGQEVVARLDTYEKVSKHLLGLRLPTGATAAPGDTLKANGKDAGFVTSVAHSPELKQGVALAYVRSAFAKPGTKLDLASTEVVVAALPHLAKA